MIAKEEFIKRLTRGILNEINDAPRKSAWTSGVCSYAVDILSRYIDCRGFNIWDEVAQNVIIFNHDTTVIYIVNFCFII